MSKLHVYLILNQDYGLIPQVKNKSIDDINIDDFDLVGYFVIQPLKVKWQSKY